MSPEALAERLRFAHPDLEPFEVEPEVMTQILIDVGVDPDADALVAATLVAWERLIS